MIYVIECEKLKGGISLMLEKSFTPLKPIPSSAGFYRYFFSQYSFIQANDLCMRYAVKVIPKEEKLRAVHAVIHMNGEENEENSVFLTGMGVCIPYLEELKKEDRGFSQDLPNVFCRLSQEGRDPLDWFLLTNEFLMVYAVCERAIIHFISDTEQTAENNGGFITEKKILSRLSQILSGRGTLKTYVKIVTRTTGGIFASMEDINAVWLYYTFLRHCIAHSAGIWDQKFHDSMENNTDSRLKNVEERLWEHPIYTGTYDIDDNPFFRNYNVGSVIEISETQLNFFRNTVLRVIEGLEKLGRQAPRPCVKQGG